MKYRNLLSFLILFFNIVFPPSLHAQALVEVAPEKVNISSQRLTHLTRAMEQYVSEKKLAGSVVLVARNNQVAYFQAFGQSDMENTIPMKKDAIFRIASQSKAIISVAIMILQEEGQLLISDPVGKYLPTFQETTVAVPTGEEGYEIVDANRSITIRDLLTHTAGIGYGFGAARDLWEAAGIQGWYFADRDEPIQETIARMGDLPFDAQPGERFVYGYNTDILGAVVEVVSGVSLEEFVQQRILTPLQMNDTHFYLPKNKKDRLAVVYSATENGLERAPDPGGMVGQGAYLDGPRKSFSGGAGYLSTAQDYAKFLLMMLNEGQFNGTRILSPKSVELMTTNHIGAIGIPWADGTGFGLGFSIVEDLGQRGSLGSEGEYGWGGAYHSSYWVDPEENLVVVYFTQLIPAMRLDDHGKLRALIYQALENQN